MQQLVAIPEIKSRAKAIGTTLAQLARDAGVSPATAYRAASGKDIRSSKLRKLTAALQAREARVARHLSEIMSHEVAA